MADPPSQEELEALHCWEADDRVPGRPAMTEFRQRLRYHQARWREANGHPYHERAKSEIPKPRNLWQYLEVAERSGVFARGATDVVRGRSELCVMWLEHLLLLSMLQHASGTWTRGRYVVVHPAGNSDLASSATDTDRCSSTSPRSPP